MRPERWQGKSALDLFPVSIGLLCSCAAFFIATDLALPGPRGAAIKAWGANDPAAFLKGEFWRPLTSMFLHGDVLHILLNMYALWMLCPALESRIGSARFSAIYFGAGLAGSLASMSFEWASIGASGAICGVLASYVRFARVELRSFGSVLRDPVASQFVVWLVLTIIMGFREGTHISNAGHIGGAIGGWAVSAALVPSGKGRTRGQLLDKPSPLKVGLLVAALGAAIAASVWPVWSASFCAEAAAVMAEKGRTADALALVDRARRAPLSREPGVFVTAMVGAAKAGQPAVAAALGELIEEEVARRIDNDAQLLQHLHAWQLRRGTLPREWQDRLGELEAKEARGELR